MAGPLLETKLHVPRRRRGLVPRPRLSERLDRGAESTLTLVSAPAGFGKTTLLAEWLAAAPAGRTVRGVALARPARQRPGVVLDLRDRRAADGGARGRRGRARAPAVAQPPPIEAVLATLLNDLGAVAGRRRAGARRLPRHRRARRPGRRWPSCSSTCPPQLHLVIASRADPALPLARLRARGELVEIRAADLRFTPDEAAAYLNEVMGLALTARGRRRAGGAHRGVDRRAPAGGAVDAGPGRRRRLHRRLRRGRPLHRRLPGRGGPAAPARGRPELPAADLHPRPAERPAVRRRHRPGRRQGDAGGARAGEPVPGPARRPPPVVPLPPPLRRRAAGAPAGRAARPRPRAAPAGERLVRAERRAVRGDPPRAGRRGLRAGGGPGRAGDPGDCAGTGRRPRCGAGSRRCPTSCSGSGPCSASAYAGALHGHAASSRASRRGCGTPSGGWTRRPSGAGRVAGRDGRRRRGGVPRACRARSRCTAPGWPWSRATSPAP